jgi:mono/diheme cytochrome c family protein
MEHRLLKHSTQSLAIATALVFFLSFPSEAKKKAGEASGAAAAGQRVFKQNCNMCHYTDKSDTKMGPGLKDLFKNKELPESHRPVTEDNVREQIQKGSPKAKPMPMPGFQDKLSPDDINNLIEYLKTL